MSAAGLNGAAEAVLERLTSLESWRRDVERDEGKLLMAFQQLRDIVITHSRGTHESLVHIRERMVTIDEHVNDLLAQRRLRGNPKLARRPRSKNGKRTRS